MERRLPFTFVGRAPHRLAPVPENKPAARYSAHPTRLDVFMMRQLLEAEQVWRFRTKRIKFALPLSLREVSGVLFVSGHRPPFRLWIFSGRTV